MNLAEYMKDKTCKGFTPKPRYSADGDMLEWYWSEKPCIAESVHVDGVWVGSVLRADDGEVVGVKVYGLKFLVGIAAEEKVL